LLSLSRAPGTIPSHVNPPRAPSDNLLLGAPQEPKLVAAPASTPAPAPTRVANAAPAAQQSDGWFSGLARKVGIGGTADATASTPPPAAPAKPKVVEAKRTEPAPRLEAAAPKTSAPKAEPKQAASRPPLKPSVTDAPAPAAAAAPAQVAGSAPIVSSNSFESRFGAMK
jgi:hypothetical protein